MNLLRLIYCVAVILALLPANAAPQAVTVCADPDPPPWTYWVRDAQNQKTTAFKGFSVDLVRAAFAKIGRSVTLIGDLPWARCINSVESGKIDFAVDAYFDEERAKRFAYSIHYNTLTPQVFFSTKAPVAVAGIADLRRFHGCGMIGASYAHYGLKTESLDLGVNTYEALIKKLKAGRCSFFVEELEVIAGYRLLGKDYLSDPEIRYGPVSDAAPPAKHLIAGKSSPAASLIPELNIAIAALIKSGEAATLWKQHAGDLAYRP